MDGGALAALGLAANILQFIDWVSHVCQVGSQIRRNGMSDFNLDLERTSLELQHQLQRIRPPSGTITCATRADQSLRRVADQCAAIVDDLLRTIQSFGDSTRKARDAKDKKRLQVLDKIRTLGQAIRFEWSKGSISTLSQKLDSYRRILELEILLDIKETLSLSTQLVSEVHTTHLLGHQETLAAVGRANATTGDLLQVHTNSIEEASRQRHEELVTTINLFIKQLQSKQLFPVLPDLLSRVDPSLRSPAINGWAKIETTILQALSFRTMVLREAEIKRNHKSTFDWIFEDPEANGKPWANFREWLQTGSGCYWVEGKAGSGKSTLMKFIAPHDLTLQYLRDWAGSARLITGSHFFWLAGTTLQKNQEGLLRSLLHTVLKQRPDLISRVFPSLYDMIMAKEFASNSRSDIFFSCEQPGCSEAFEQPRKLAEHLINRHSSHRHASTEKELHPDPVYRVYPITDSLGSARHEIHDDDICGSLRLAELKNAFLALAQQDLANMKICLFVDGLDEYFGDPHEILNLFKEATSYSSILKIVVSSRPEPEFKEAFRQNPGLRLEDLTWGDITQYVKETLNSHSRMRVLQQRNTQAAQKLVSAVVSRSSGVFLWVFLVARLLLDALTDGSYLEELEKILESYPKELRELYEHMLSRMKPSHRIQAAKLFQCISECFEVEGNLPTAFRLSFVENDNPIQSLSEPMKFMTSDQVQERILLVEARLRSRCCGLVEVRTTDSKAPSQWIQHKEGHLKFLHRSVSEFLKEPEICAQIEAETHGTHFNCDESLMSSTLSSLKSNHFFAIKNYSGWKRYIQGLKFFWEYCHRSEVFIGTERQFSYLRELDNILGQIWNSIQSSSSYETEAPGPGSHWADSALRIIGLKVSSASDTNPLLTLAARYGLSSYVYYLLHFHPPSDAAQAKYTDKMVLLMALICWLMTTHSIQLRQQHLQIIETLLEEGFDIKSRNGLDCPLWEKNPWEVLLYLRPMNLQRHSFPTAVMTADASIFTDAVEVDIFEDWARVIVIFVSHGAKLDVAYQGVLMGKTGQQCIQERLQAVSSTTRPLCGKDRDRIRSTIEFVNKALQAHIIDATSTSNHRKNKTRGRRRNDKSLPTPPSSDAQSSTRSTRTYEHTDTKSHTQEGTWNSSPGSSADGICRRCKAVREITDMGFTADNAIQALDQAGAGTNTQALISWILDQETTFEAGADSMARSELGSKALLNQVQNGELKYGASTISSSKTWSKVAGSAVPSSTQVKEIVGAELVFKQKTPKQRRRPKTQDVVSEKTREEELSSSGVINLKVGSLTWFLDESTNATKAPVLSSTQVQALNEYLDLLLTDI